MPRLSVPTIPTGFLSVPQAPAPIAAGPSRPHPPAPAPAKAKARPAPGNDEPRVRAFIETTYNLVCSGVGCWWSDDGDSFVICEEAFPTTCNIKSFIRQANHYGFSKIRLPSSAGTVLSRFSHPLFKRGRPDLLPRIRPKRTAAGPATAPATAAAAAAATADHSHKGGGLVASLRARVSELEGKLEETEGALVTLQELFQRLTGGKRGRDEHVPAAAADEGVFRPDRSLGLEHTDLDLDLDFSLDLDAVAPNAKRPRTSSPRDNVDVDAWGRSGAGAPPFAPSFGVTSSSSCSGLSASSGMASDVSSPRGAACFPTRSFDELCDAVCRREDSADGLSAGAMRIDVARQGEDEGVGLLQPGPEPEDTCDRSEVSDLDSQDPLSLDLDALTGVMSECSLSLDGGLDEARSLTLSLDLETTDGGSDGPRSLGLTAIHSVGTDSDSNSAIMSVERERGLTRSSSFELMRKLLNALPPAGGTVATDDSGGGDGVVVAPVCSAADAVDGELGGVGEATGGPSEVEMRAQ